MIRAAVLGSPISHSLSPKIHRRAYEILGISANYEAIEVDENSFRDFFAKNSDETWSGYSLTMPLKEVVLSVAGVKDERCVRINSANTLFRSGEVWSALSTDLMAFENLINVGRNAKVVLIGGGATARAAAGALNSKVESFDVLLRNPQRLDALSKAAPSVLINSLDMTAPLDGYNLIIQTTPSGAYDLNVPKLERADGLLLECLYKPWPTPLVARFSDLGGSVISGKDLLVEQALFQIELFTQVKFDFSEMRSALLEHIASD